MMRLSRTEVLFKKGLAVFEDEICIESILRSIHKLQGSVAALMENNNEAQHVAKLIYFGNQIMYRSAENERKMRYTSDFLEFLRFQVAETITYEHACEHHQGQFRVLSKFQSNKRGAGNKNIFKEDKLEVSQKFRESI